MQYMYLMTLPWYSQTLLTFANLVFVKVGTASCVGNYLQTNITVISVFVFMCCHSLGFVVELMGRMMVRTRDLARVTHSVKVRLCFCGTVSSTDGAQLVG